MEGKHDFIDCVSKGWPTAIQWDNFWRVVISSGKKSLGFSFNHVKILFLSLLAVTQDSGIRSSLKHRGGKGRSWNRHHIEVPPLYPHLLSPNAIFVPFTMLVEKGWKWWWREQQRPSGKLGQIVWSSSWFLRILSPSVPCTENLAGATDSPLCYIGDNRGFLLGLTTWFPAKTKLFLR